MEKQLQRAHPKPGPPPPEAKQVMERNKTRVPSESTLDGMNEEMLLEVHAGLMQEMRNSLSGEETQYDRFIIAERNAEQQSLEFSQEHASRETSSSGGSFDYTEEVQMDLKLKRETLLSELLHDDKRD